MMSTLSTQQRILLIAEEIMADKGLSATISQIASRSGVKDSVLYHYFKNKEDILFSIAGERLRDLREKMTEQLSGIDDPLSRLRKLIHFRLYYMDKHRNYGKLLLFECRSNMSFFHHRAFDQARWFMSALGDILRDGITQGVFRETLNVWLIRDAVFGVLDLANMAQLLSSESNHERDFAAIMDLVQPMVLEDNEPHPLSRDKRARILHAAETVFAEKGFAGATIQDISSLAGIGDGTVYDYFKNKDDLLMHTIMEGFQPSSLKKGFQDHLDSGRGHPEPEHALDKLDRFIRRHFMISLTQPSFAKIFILNGIYNKSFYGSQAGLAVRNYLDGLSHILHKGKDQGLIRKGVDTAMFERLVLGAFSHMTLRWLIYEHSAVLNKVGEINTMVESMIRSVSTTQTAGQDI